MVRHLVAAQEGTARTARKLPPMVAAANDPPAADLLTQRLNVHQKTAAQLVGKVMHLFAVDQIGARRR